MKRKKLIATSPQLSITEAFDKFNNHNKIKGLSKDTMIYYNTYCSKFIKFLPDNIPINSVNKDIVEEYTVYLKSEVSDVTVNTSLRAIKTFLNYCMENNMMPHFKISLMKEQKKIKDPYDIDELKKLLKKPDLKKCRFSEYRNWVIVNFLLSTGCRASTLVNIRIQDINFSDELIVFRHMKSGIQQTVPMSNSIKIILNEYLQYRNGQPDDYLFVSEYDKKLTRNTLSNAIRSYNRSRGVGKTSLHLFRHTYAKMFVMAGGDPFRLKRILGHADIKTTQKYVTLYTNDLKQDYDKLNPLEQMNQLNAVRHKIKK